MIIVTRIGDTLLKFQNLQESSDYKNFQKLWVLKWPEDEN